MKIEVSGCENVHRLTGKLVSGGEPQGEAALRALATLGIRTIISVDGGTPDAAAAGKLGLRYVHLPIGYDGIDRKRMLELARAVRDLQGPLYIHCHHGLHRGPAAAAGALVALGEWSNDQAVGAMKVLGASPKYEGLFADVRELRASLVDVDGASAEFPAAASLPGFVARMAEIDRRWEHLGAIRKAGWKKAPEHPDLDPPHEAVQFRELFAELLRSGEVKERPEDFRRRMNRSEEDAGALEKGLKSGDAAAAEQAFDRIDAACKACHADYRNRRRPK